MDLERINELGFEKSSKWKTIVLIVSFSKWWNLLIAFQCYIVFLLCLSNLAFNYQDGSLILLRYTFDLFYVFEIVCTVSYRRNVRFRKLLYARGRGWFFIALDIISVIPFELFYTFHVILDLENVIYLRILIQNRLLRIYRIFQLEALYGMTVRKHNQYLIFMFFQFMSKAILIGHILCCIWVNLEKSVSCDPKKFTCFFWYEVNMLNVVILNWSGTAYTFRNFWERFLITCGIFVGILLTYVYFYPYTLYVSMQLNSARAIYFDKYKKLERFVHNMTDKPSVREKILGYFIDAWQGTSDLSSLLNNTPLALKKEICTDIYWEAFRHSELLRSVTRSCKRSLSLVMTTNHYHSGEVIFAKGQNKQMMLFLIQGIVQVMAEENEKSPLLSFSGGTVFGELSLFLYTPSQALVKCKSYCEFQILTMAAAVNVFKDYPKDKKQIFRKLQQRIAMARYTQWRKNEFGLKEKNEVLGLESSVVEDCVKWIKTQWTAVWEGHKRQRMIIKAVEEGLRLPSFHRTLVHPDTKIEFISNYLELIVLSDVFEEKKDAVCLRTDFPWSIDPSAPFLGVWYYIVLVTSLIPAICYPYCTFWLTEFPQPVYVISFLVTAIFQVDVAIKVFTAVKTKHHIITRFSSVLYQRIKEPTFYLDVIASLPYQIFIIFHRGELNTYEVGLLLHPAILKSHMLVSFKIPLSSYIDKLKFLQNTLVFIYLLYLFAEGIQFFYVRSQRDEISQESWYGRFLINTDSYYLRHYLISVIKALMVALGVPDYNMYPDDDGMLLIYFFINFFFFFFFCFFLGEFYGTHVLRIYSQETFLVLLRRIIKFLNSIYLPRSIANRLIKTLKFQWIHNYADYLSSEVPIIKSTPSDLRKQIYSESTYKTLGSCKLFEDEPHELLVAVMEKSFIVAVPSGSLLVTSGHTSHMISIIHRGVCQVSSFLGNDTSAGLGSPYILNSGDAFPVLSSFCCVPAPVAVVSLTDCELIMIHLNDLLKIFMDFNYLKDVLEVLKELDVMTKLLEVKPGLIGLGDVTAQTKLNDSSVKKSCFARVSGLLYKLCYRGSRFSAVKFIARWEAFYSAYLIFLSVLWPNCFGLLAYSSHILIPFLICTKLVIFINFFINFGTPYYNKIGILVTHPGFTIRNYLSTAFFIDFVCFFPLFAIIRYGTGDPMKKPPTWLVAINFTQHFLKVIHILGFFDNLENILNSQYAIRITKTIVTLLMAFNLFVNFMMFLLADWIYGAPFKIVGFDLPQQYRPDIPEVLPENSLLDYYIFIAHWMMCSLNTVDYDINIQHDIQLFVSLALNFVGTFLHFYIYCWIASNSLFTYLGETLFQEKITSFVKFLESENADEKVIEYALSYYDYEWSKTRGEDLKNIFERLPTHLHEEFVYPVYRPTLSKNFIFSGADEGFYRILAKHLCCVYFNRGSVIIFQNEVQSDLYFLHKGKCFVYDWFLILDKGSLMGDIKRTGLMQNKIYALTHVELLKISSMDFFMIINYFDSLEAAFFRAVENVENFIQCTAPSHGYPLRPVDSKDILNAFGLQNKVFGFEDESYFEERDKASLLMRKTMKYKIEDKKWIFTIYPGSWQMKAFIYLTRIDAFFTIIIIPFFVSFGTLTVEAFLAIGILDIFWLFVILLSFRVGFIDKVKGDVITDFKFIAKKYVKRLDGFVIDVLALIPFEFIHILSAGGFKKADPETVAWLRILRLLRGICFFKDFKTESQKLKTNYILIYVNIILYMIMTLFIVANVILAVATEEAATSTRNPHVLTARQFFVFVICCEQVVNLFASANIRVLTPETRTQLVLNIVLNILSPCLKGLLISKVLSILYSKGMAKSIYKSQVVALESYLEGRETSPCLIRGALDYKFKLLEYGRSENMPSFLVKCPVSLRMGIMKDLYHQHLKRCPLFEKVDEVFLSQLLARMTREIYFSGQMIVEQFDVDHRMYFIHKGEVYVINQTKDKAYVEFVIGRMGSGEYFGEAQGLWFSLPHAYSYRARTLVEVVVLHSDDWIDLRRSFPGIAKTILEKAKSYRFI